MSQIETVIANALAEAPTANQEILDWVAEVARQLTPDNIRWANGSEEEWCELTEQLVASGAFIKLNPNLRPNSFLARSHPGDVARVEERTFICSEKEIDAGPTNNWVAPAEMKATLKPLFDGAMRGRTMYVVPFAMGPIGGKITQYGLEITDSEYAVLNMRIMTRMGQVALDAIKPGDTWVKTVHSVGAPLEPGQEDVAWPCNETKYITHFPETLEVWSYGSGYGGNALLSKKCFALRIASVMARNEGWLAEHMLLLKLTNEESGKSYHVSAAFPSACGKTNLAMLQPTIPGWKVETIGDDIVWLKPDEEGYLRAINPEAGFFGVAPGTGYSTNPVAMDTLWGNTIYTNVALTDDGDVWWEGMTDEAPAHLIDWLGNDWTPESGTPAAHPNSRFTAPATQAPSFAEVEWNDDFGVRLDAILFGGRRASNVPLVTGALSWDHGVYMGANISSERTAAAEGVVGELRRDPFAMLPFCGYNMGDYWQHWVELGEKKLSPEHAPRVFQVNWFRKDANGKFIWPGFGDNARVLEWIIRVLENPELGEESPIGILPAKGSLNVDGLDISDETMAELFAVDNEAWLNECKLTEEFFATFGDRLPKAMIAQLRELEARLK